MIKKDFNIDCIYLDNAATTLKPKEVIESYYNNFYFNGDISFARERVSRYLNVPKESIKFTRGTTNSLNLIAKHYKNKIESVSLPISAHHSNLIPWQKIAKKIEYIDLNDKGELKAIPQSDLLAIDHVSNVLGTINNVKNLRENNNNNNNINKNSLIVIDGAQAPSHLKVDLKEIDCDFYTFSSHKMYGPTGLGILYDKYNLIEEDYTNYRAIISFLASIEYMEKHSHMITNENELLSTATEKMLELGLEIYGRSDKKAPIISFNVRDIHPHDLSTFLSERGIAIRAGNHCAQPLMRYLNVNATARISFGIYNTLDDIDKFIIAIKECINFFKHN